MLSKFRTGLNMIWQREVIFYEQRAKCPTTLLHLIEITRRLALFDRLHYPRWVALLRLADQEMNVIGHGDVAYDHKTITPADCFEHHQKQIAPLPARQPGSSMITTAGDEMQLIGAVIAPGMVGHRASLMAAAETSCDL
jgi:hypothetical protein